jgi:hypothetical protein
LSKYQPQPLNWPAQPEGIESGSLIAAVKEDVNHNQRSEKNEVTIHRFLHSSGAGFQSERLRTDPQPASAATISIPIAVAAVDAAVVAAAGNSAAQHGRHG